MQQQLEVWCREILSQTQNYTREFRQIREISWIFPGICVIFLKICEGSPTQEISRFFPAFSRVFPGFPGFEKSKKTWKNMEKTWQNTGFAVQNGNIRGFSFTKPV